MKDKKTELYLAGPLFNAGERVHMILLKKALKSLGYENIVLPQVEAVKFQNPKTYKFDVKGIVEDCLSHCCSSEVIVVACIDGPDADSGTCVEVGAAVGYARAKGVELRIVVYRTDFRTNLETECGVNAMLLSEGVLFVFNPCYILEEEKEIRDYYEELAQLIYQKICEFV